MKQMHFVEGDYCVRKSKVSLNGNVVLRDLHRVSGTNLRPCGFGLALWVSNDYENC